MHMHMQLLINMKLNVQAWPGLFLVLGLHEGTTACTWHTNAELANLGDSLQRITAADLNAKKLPRREIGYTFYLTAYV